MDGEPIDLWFFTSFKIKAIKLQLIPLNFLTHISKINQTWPGGVKFLEIENFVFELRDWNLE
jgi:hypothetical protein